MNVEKHFEQAYLVKDWMQTDLKTIHPDTSLKDTVSIMIREKTNGLVVVDDINHVVGIVSSWDIIKYIVPDYLEDDKHLAAFESADIFAKRIIGVENDTIDKCMTKSVQVIGHDKPLMEVIALLAEYHIRQLPVVNEKNVLIGYLNRTDIKRAVWKVMQEHDACEHNEGQTV
ncbi:MAG: CBS domain-containing protein [Candidatus Magasanikbacteria bacterium]|uniref:CBS domain-containing protein n=1 Tax=Candidatus Magasanikbacteria bacterium CG10_big_fil_rev_8_21_14_0_10_38_6 TaxID=1974647 RepID=A0A2M6NZU0_9BACT|nr:CBS domain-containing protein [Candidatus Magasanikbacteria bacterium]NCS71817.1 CBS domain-containing protein [Candidatus Magasanikbacteria bacterium]PIR76992.1 MAG: hypothetical protein COU30_04855 [Candidatus Magasanikbacteria bacterium CG10_big_fil_rev_8_21_14_0_10_38_6]